VKGFAKIASTLTNLLKKTTKFKWNAKRERAFQELKQHLIIAVILTLSMEGKAYTIYNDVSKNG